MRSPRATAVAMLVATALFLEARPATALVEVLYNVVTSAPSGRAVCSIEGSAPDAVAADELQITVTPFLGQEARLTIRDALGGETTTAAGVEEACDIFDPDAPSGTVSLFGSQLQGTFFGVLDIHAHPSGDCFASDLGEGLLSAQIVGPGPGTVKLKVKRCDAVQTRANLRTTVDSPPSGATGEVLTQTVHVTNHGPGSASNARIYAKLSPKAHLADFIPSQGTCSREDHELVCELGTIAENPLVPGATLTLHQIPFKTGTLVTSFEVGADNSGDVFDDKIKTKTPIAKGSAATLAVSIDCRKGAAGTITIDPDGAGGTTTCTCPDPNGLDDFLCALEVYTVATTVTLTPGATTGTFDKWKKDCKGQSPNCTLTLDPAAQNPDKSAEGKFKP